MKVKKVINNICTTCSLKNYHDIPVGCWEVEDAATVLVEEVATRFGVTWGSAIQETYYSLIVR